MMARVYAQDPDAIRKAQEAAPHIPASLFAKLLKIGEGSMHPSLLLNGCVAYQRLATLPYHSQDQAIKAGRVPVVINAATGESLSVPLVELTPAQATQVISTTGVRTKQEQQSFLRSRQVDTSRAEATEKIVGPLYSIRGRNVEFNVGCTLSQQDLLRILSEMAK